MNFLSKHVRDCIDACYKAIAACERCADAVSDPAVHELARECADVAALCLRLLDRQSSLASDLAALCIRACRACATACAQLESPAALECLEATRRCAAVLDGHTLLLGSLKSSRSVANHDVAH